MPKLSCIFVVAAAATVAAATPVSAASVGTNLSVGHVSTGHFGGANVGASPRFNTDKGPKQKPKPQTDQGGCHTVKTSIIRCYN